MADLYFATKSVKKASPFSDGIPRLLRERGTPPTLIDSSPADLTTPEMDSLHANARVGGKVAPKILPLSKNQRSLVIVRGRHGSGATTYAHSLGIPYVVDLGSIIRQASGLGVKQDWRLLSCAILRSFAAASSILESGHSCVIAGAVATGMQLHMFERLRSLHGVENLIVVNMVGEFPTSIPRKGFMIARTSDRFLEHINTSHREYLKKTIDTEELTSLSLENVKKYLQ